MCLFPKELKVTLKDGNSEVINVRCGKCIECLQLRTHDWEFRMIHEKNQSDFTVFVTLTYDEIYCPKDGVQVTDLQLLHKRLRKAGVHFKYYAIGEYGTKTFRPHYHCIYFLKDESTTYSEFHELLLQQWRYGFIQYKKVTNGRIHYCIAYLIGQKWPKGQNKPFTIMSKKPSIGYSLLEDKNFIEQAKSNNYDYVIRNGKRVHMPRYYRTKLTESQCTKLDLYLIRCRQHLCFLQKYRDFCLQRGYDFKTALNGENVLFKHRKNYNPILREFKMYEREQNENKDFILKQRNKKLKND